MHVEALDDGGVCGSSSCSNLVPPCRTRFFEKRRFIGHDHLQFVFSLGKTLTRISTRKSARRDPARKSRLHSNNGRVVQVCWRDTETYSRPMPTQPPTMHSKDAKNNRVENTTALVSNLYNTQRASAHSLTIQNCKQLKATINTNAPCKQIPRRVELLYTPMLEQHIGENFARTCTPETSSRQSFSATMSNSLPPRG